MNGSAPGQNRGPHSTGSADRFKRLDASSYDAVTDAYDRFTRRLSAPLAQRLTELAAPTPGSRVLDVGTGSGVVALEAAGRLGARGRVIGVDLSAGMLAAAERNALAAGVSERVAFLRQDAEKLSFGDGSFDAVLSLFALLHFPAPRQALTEMFRVLRPGGTLALAIGCAPPRLSLLGAAYLWRRLPFILQTWRGRWLAAPAFLDSLVARHLPGGEEPELPELARSRRPPSAMLPGMVRAAGFTAVRTACLARLAVLPTADEFWDLQATFSSFARKRLAAAPRDKRRAIRQEFDERCHRLLAAGGRLTYPHAAFYVTARRPAQPG